MKEEAEERARRMVHGEIVFEMRNKEHAAIEYYLSLRALENKLPKSGFGAVAAKVATGPMLGIQIVPHIAITDRPRLAHMRLVEVGVPTSERIFRGPTTDNKGASGVDQSETSRIDTDATSETWINYPRTSNMPKTNTLPALKIAEDIVSYIKNVRGVIKEHNVRSDKLVVRGRLENAMGKIVTHSIHVDGVPVNQVIVETDYVVLDIGEEVKFLEEFWYCLGWSYGLPGSVADHVKG
jgi:hypothetical protein